MAQSASSGDIPDQGARESSIWEAALPPQGYLLAVPHTQEQERLLRLPFQGCRSHPWGSGSPVTPSQLLAAAASTYKFGGPTFGRWYTCQTYTFGNRALKTLDIIVIISIIII